MSKPATSRGQFLQQAWEVAAYFLAHDAYGRNEAAACRALKRRCPGFTKRQYQNAFRKGLALYEAATAAIEPRSGELMKQCKTEEVVDFREFFPQMRRACPGFSAATYASALWWILFWHHLK